LALGRPKCKQENIKWILQNYGVNWIQLVQDRSPVAGFCENSMNF
jgi:hypothetical protein